LDADPFAFAEGFAFGRSAITNTCVSDSVLAEISGSNLPTLLN
jgi:hypothetical protein